MNEEALNDPILQSLEARLAASVPQLSADEQQRLLYACAFKAGLQASARSARGWRVVAACLGVAVIGLVVPRINGPATVAHIVPMINEPQRTGVRTDNLVAHVEDSMPRFGDTGTAVERSSQVRLDAWRRSPSMVVADSIKLPRDDSSVVGSDGLTVGGLNVGALD